MYAELYQLLNNEFDNMKITKMIKITLSRGNFVATVLLKKFGFF